MPSINVTDDPDEYDEAVRAFRKRVPMPDWQWDALTEAEREFAFKVSGVAQADLVKDAWEAIDRAVKDGTTLEDFKREVGAKLEGAWGREDRARLETIFRTNVLGAYNGGRHEILSHPEVKQARPYWRFDAVMDNRTSEICDALDGIVKPADDPFWGSHTPPLHFNCRSVLTPLSDEEAADEGVTANDPGVDADEGFGKQPTGEGDAGSGWEPDPKEYPAPIADVLEGKLEEGPANDVLPDVEPTPPAEVAPAPPAGRESAERELRELATSPIREVRARFGEHTANLNTTLHVELEAGQRGFFKPAAGEQWARPQIPEGTYYKREAAAYQLDRELGINLVPDTVVREGPGGIGSLQREHPADLASHLVKRNVIPGLREWSPSEVGGRVLPIPDVDAADRSAFQRMRFLDIVAGNTDRHNGNWLRRHDAKGRLVPAPIDHGLCFPTVPTVANPRAPEVNNPTVHGPLEADVRGLIKKADLDKVGATLKAAGLEPEAVHGALVRLDFVKRYPDLVAYSDEVLPFESAAEAKVQANRWAGGLERDTPRPGVQSAMERLFPGWAP